jgi:hypothetical protein
VCVTEDTDLALQIHVQVNEVKLMLYRVSCIEF